MAAFPAIASERLETEERLKAIGPVNGLLPALQRALAAEDFTPLPAPGPQDWFAVRPEPGQTFEEFQRSQPNRPEEQRRIIYLQPLRNFPEKQSPSTEMLRQYAAAFFQMEVKILPSVNIVPRDFTSRTNQVFKDTYLIKKVSWHGSRSPVGRSARIVGSRN